MLHFLCFLSHALSLLLDMTISNLTPIALLRHAMITNLMSLGKPRVREAYLGFYPNMMSSMNWTAQKGAWNATKVPWLAGLLPPGPLPPASFLPSLGRGWFIAESTPKSWLFTVYLWRFLEIYLFWTFIIIHQHKFSLYDLSSSNACIYKLLCKQCFEVLQIW